jgi:hypothetical protein
MVSIRLEYKHKEANIAFVFVGFIEFEANIAFVFVGFIEFEVKKMVANNFDV